MKPRLSNDGHTQVALRNIEGRRDFLVSHLVLRAFCSEPPIHGIAYHKDGDNKNNDIHNLEWLSSTENRKIKKKVNKQSTAIWGKDSIAAPIEKVEVWKAIGGFDKMYEVSNYGRIKSIGRKVRSGKGHRIVPEKILINHLSKTGWYYTYLCFRNTRKIESVHRLVLTAFVGPCPKGMEGCHNDGDPRNNNLFNLRWDTRSSNQSDRVLHGTDNRGTKNHSCKTSEDTVRTIRSMWESGDYTQKEISNILNTNISIVKNVICDRTWKHV